MQTQSPNLRFGAWWLVGILVAYAAFHVFMRLSFSGNFVTDDVMSVLHTRSLKPIYSALQPPLYEWVLWTMQQVFGVSFLAVLATKYIFLGGAAFFLYRAALLVIKDQFWAALCVLSYSLFYQIAWNLLEGSTHTSAVIFASAITIWMVLRLVEDAGFVNYVLLGIAIGFGLLSKFSYMMLLIAILISLFAYYWARQRILIVEVLGSVGLGLIIAAPYWWSLATAGDGAGVAVDRLTRASESSELWSIVIGPVKVVTSYLLYSLAFLPLVVGFFWRPIRQNMFNSETRQNNLLILCVLIFGSAFALLFISTLLFGVTHVKERHMHPFFLVLPIIAFALVAKGDVNAQRVRVFSYVLLFVAIGIGAVRFVTLAFPYEEVCGRCRERIPYEKLATDLKSNPDIDTIISNDPYTAANLLRLMPEYNVIYTGQPISEWPTNCAIVAQDLSNIDRFFKSSVTAEWSSLFGDTPIRVSTWDVATYSGVQGHIRCKIYFQVATDGA